MSNKELWEGFVSAAQRKAVWASKADGGKGHPDNKKKKSKKEDTAVDEASCGYGSKKKTNEVSKDMMGRYLKKATPSAADGGRDSVMGSGKEKQGVKKVINRITGTQTAVDKMTGKAKVPATEEKHVFRFSTKSKQGNHHHDSKDHKGAAAAIEKKTGEKVTSMTYRGTADSRPKPRLRSEGYSSYAQQKAVWASRADKKKGKKEANEPSQAVKDFLAKGGKIKKLPPAHAQGYHGKDDPGKDVKGVMDRPDTKAMGTRKKVKSMESKTFFDLRSQLTENAALSHPVLSRRHADAEKAHKAAAKREGSSNPAAMRTHQAAAHYHSKAREELAAGNHKAAMKHANTAMKHVSYTDSGSATPSWARKAKEASKLAVSHHHDAHKQVKEEIKLDESMLGHRDAEKLNGGKSKDPNFKSPESHIDHHHRQTGGHNKSGGDQDRHRYQVAKKLGYDV